ncbi:MAG: TRAP transporter substrate-binding protein [Gammaproteobacteria bacterium]|nr:MAG: TRAP transporter substrate-binding protein [Gammaproteobacteria bacterium]
MNVTRIHLTIGLTFLSLFLFTVSSQADVLKIATLSPDGTSWMKKIRLAAKDITKQTNNRVKIKFYPGGVMGDENAILRKMRINQLQGAAVTGGALTGFYKDANIYGMPFLFNSQKEVIHVRKYVDELILRGLEKKGLISFGLAEAGFAYIFSNSVIESVSDLRKYKVWIPDTAAARDAVKAFELSPIPLPLSDVLTGLQTGLIDTIASPPIASIALQWYTQVKYITDMPVLYGYGTMVVSKRAMKKLKKADREIVNKVMRNVFKEINKQNQKDNIAAMAALKNQGIKFIKPNDKQLGEWKSIALKANQRLVHNGFNSEKMFNLIQKHIADFRNK